MSSSGGTRTHSILRSKRGWSANCLPSRVVKCHGPDSNRQSRGFKPCRSANWRTWATVVPEGIEPSLSGCKPEVVPLDHGTVYCVEWTHRELHPNLQRAELVSSCWTMSPLHLASGSRGTRTHKRREAATCFQDRLLIQPDDFRSCRSKKLRELESNQRPPGSEPGATTSSSYPGIKFFKLGEKDLNLHNLGQSQAAYR